MDGCFSPSLVTIVASQQLN